MAIKYKLEASEYDTLDEAIKPNYVEQDGTYILDLEGNDVQKTMLALQKERDVVKSIQQQKRELEQRLKELESAPKVKNENSDELPTDSKEIIDKQVKAKMFGINQELEELKSKYSQTESQLQEMRKKEKSLLLKEEINNLISKNPKFNDSASKFLHKLGVSELEYDPDRKAFNNDTFPTLEDWVNSQVDEYPMLYKPSVGAGATGGKTGVKKVPTMEDQIKGMFKN